MMRLPADRFNPGLKRLLGLVAVIIFCGSCTAPPAPPLRIGTNVWPGYEPLYLARDLGYLGEDIHLVEYSSASQVIKAFQNGAIEVAALTLDEVMLLQEKAQDPKIILVLDVSNGADAILARPEIKTMSQIKGRRVGVENTAAGAYLLSRAMEMRGVKLSDIHITPISIEEHLRAYQEGRVDVVVTFDPVRSKLVSGGATQLFDSSEIPGEIVDVLVVHHDDHLHGEQINKLLRSWFRALDYLSENPDAAAAKIAKRLRLRPSEVMNMYKGIHLPSLDENKDLLVGSSPGIYPSAQRLADVMVSHHLLKEPIDVKSIFDSEHILSLKP